MTTNSDPNDFKTVTSGGGRRRNDGLSPTVTFLGVECPKCLHVFMPKIADDKTVCPACGHTKHYDTPTLTPITDKPLSPT